MLCLCQHRDEIAHILGEIAVFPVTDVEVAVVFHTLERVGDAVRQKFRRHVDVVLRADHDGVAGDCGALCNFNADRLKKDFRLNVFLDKQAVLGVSDAVSGFLLPRCQSGFLRESFLRLRNSCW